MANAIGSSVAHIVETSPGVVAIRYEMIHDVRMIRVNGGPRLPDAMKSKRGPLFTMAMSFNNKGPFGGFYRYIGEEETYKVYRDSMTDSEGKDVPLDNVPAFDRQDVEFVSAIREGREPESSAASVVPTMALLDKIDKAMGH